MTDPITQSPVPALPTCPALAAALAKAQGEFPPISKDREVEVKMKTGGTYTFRYATLDNIYKTLRPALAANGLAIFATLAGEPGRAVVVTHLVHSSGESWSSTLYPPGGATDMQGLGSQLSYLQRYGVTAMLGIASTEDDDGSIADGHGYRDANEDRPAPTKAPPPKGPNTGAPAASKGQQATPPGKAAGELTYITDAQMAAIDAELQRKGHAPITWQNKDAEVPDSLQRLCLKISKNATPNPAALNPQEAEQLLTAVQKLPAATPAKK